MIIILMTLSTLEEELEESYNVLVEVYRSKGLNGVRIHREKHGSRAIDSLSRASMAFLADKLHVNCYSAIEISFLSMKYVDLISPIKVLKIILM